MFVVPKRQEGNMRAHDQRSGKVLVLRLNRVFAEMNAFLLALAIGLAALDTTYFIGTRYVDLLKHMPPLTQTAPAAEPAIADAGVVSAR
jgi:hypothetical protein